MEEWRAIPWILHFRFHRGSNRYPSSIHVEDERDGRELEYHLAHYTPYR